MGKRRGPTKQRQREWKPLRRGDIDPEFQKLLDKFGPDERIDEVWGNDVYTVMVRYSRRGDEVLPRTELLHLSFHRHDRKAIRDWRHGQAIKNEIAGPERLAVEVYPPESKLVDTSNEYHLWVMPVGMEMPFGFDGKLVAGPGELDHRMPSGKAPDKYRQRDWQEGVPTGKGTGPGTDLGVDLEER